MRSITSTSGNPAPGNFPGSTTPGNPVSVSVAAPPPDQLQCLAERLNVAFVEDLSSHEIDPSFIERIPISHARRHGVLGLTREGNTLLVAITSLDSWQKLDVIARTMGCMVRPLVTTPEQLTGAINRAYQSQEGAAESFIEHLRKDVDQIIDPRKDGLAAGEDLLDTAGRAPVIKLINLVLFEAVKAQASDVHVQPYEDRVIVRMRIDGVLFDAFDLPKGRQDEVVSRVKVMGKMNIAEKRLPQDGRTTVQVGDRIIDLRISVIPTSFGERIVIRLLDKSARLYTLPELGMPPEVLNQFREFITVEHGLILVTGPTGSGKSTTLYAALQQINGKEKNILTLEDPIEYQLPGISQTQVSTRKGMTFASGLRSVLRQDPDIIMVGEIRDHETAVMAIQSALTGHLVFSTLHTNDAASAVARLLDLGIEPYLVASSLVAVLAQRLTRRVCDKCAHPIEADIADLARIGIAPDDAVDASIRNGVGCDVCRDTGYRGRLGLFELLTINNKVRRLVNARQTAAAIKSQAIESGMRTLRDDGVEKVLAGQTTIDEVLRVTMQAQPDDEDED
ncbi:type II secretion system ATPase GspE [Planctomycetales bacterium ZRK34]|nr:type II secretion system ATPase GspE [Planctomycetales bacterium ZRK34]